jgi:branched-chain amino acid transport system permease protein
MPLMRFWPGLALALILAAPLVTSPYQTSVLLLIFMNIALATSWNLIGGYTGRFTFGHVAYFGIGAYVGALSIARFGLHWLSAALFAGLAAAAAAAIVGHPSLRVRGPAFVILTLAFSQTLRIAVHIFDGTTGGASGISLPPAHSLTEAYFAFAAVALISVAAIWQIDRSAFGRRLKAIRDDEFAAEAIGINTQREKLKSFVMSAIPPGLCGALYAWYLGYINPEEAFSLRTNVSMIVMVLLGGAGTVFGPVIGAVLVFMVSELLWARFPEVHQLAFGVALMALVLFAPNGLIGWLRRRSADERRSD